MADELVIKKETAELIADTIRGGLKPTPQNRRGKIAGSNFAAKIQEGLDYQRSTGKQEGENLHANDYSNGYTIGLEDGKKKGIAEEEKNILSALVYVEAAYDSDASDYFAGYQLVKDNYTSKYEIVWRVHNLGPYESAEGYFLPYTRFIPTTSIHSYTAYQEGWKLENGMLVPDES